MSFGTSPFGTHLFGIGGGDPSNAFELIPITLPDRLFSPPGQVGVASPLLADNIDPATKDFADLFVGLDPVDAAVQVAITTTRGSGACVFNVGLRVTNSKLTSDFKRITEADVRLALSDLVNRRDIDIVGLSFGAADSNTGKVTGDVFEADASAQVNVNYINLRAYDGRIRSMPLTSGSSERGLVYGVT